ncbi:MAG: hypothetical protein QOD10_2997 [Mycobacterium sp.]|nr:hypothetical protein [Mycobacterium sp.]
MWGDLWRFPFWADVWGTVASWFGAVGTVASVATAAFYYVKNQRRKEKAQARHVDFVHSHWTGYAYHAKVHNFSDESIFDVTPMKGRKFSFREVVANEYREKGALSKDEIEDLLFPALCLPTGELPTVPTAYPSFGDRGVMMPIRRRTREQDRAYRIDAERALNAALVAECNQPPPFDITAAE